MIFDDFWGLYRAPLSCNESFLHGWVHKVIVWRGRNQQTCLHGLVCYLKKISRVLKILGGVRCRVQTFVGIPKSAFHQWTSCFGGKILWCSTLHCLAATIALWMDVIKETRYFALNKWDSVSGLRLSVFVVLRVSNYGQLFLGVYDVTIGVDFIIASYFIYSICK